MLIGSVVASVTSATAEPDPPLPPAADRRSTRAHLEPCGRLIVDVRHDWNRSRGRRLERQRQRRRRHLKHLDSSRDRDVVGQDVKQAAVPDVRPSDRARRPPRWSAAAPRRRSCRGAVRRRDPRARRPAPADRGCCGTRAAPAAIAPLRAALPPSTTRAWPAQSTVPSDRDVRRSVGASTRPPAGRIRGFPRSAADEGAGAGEPAALRA